GLRTGRLATARVDPGSWRRGRFDDARDHARVIANLRVGRVGDCSEGGSGQQHPEWAGSDRARPAAPQSIAALADSEPRSPDQCTEESYDGSPRSGAFQA